MFMTDEFQMQADELETIRRINRANTQNWAVELDRKLDLVIYLLKAQNKPQDNKDGN